MMPLLPDRLRDLADLLWKAKIITAHQLVDLWDAAKILDDINGNARTNRRMGGGRHLSRKERTPDAP